MAARRLVLLVAVAALAPAFAGCAEEAPAARDDRLTPGASGGAIDRPFQTPPPPKPMAQRWHFHDHWRGQPTLTLFNDTVTLNATLSEEGLPALSARLELPPGVIVPPETGEVRVHVAWANDSTPPAGGLVNVTYRPADSPSFHPGGDASNGEHVSIAVSESMADVPHRAASLWAFNLTAKPDPAHPMLPPHEVHVTITATIGRPLFIDPPHVDWWQGRDVLPLVEAHEASLGAARTPVANATLPPLGAFGSSAPAPGDFAAPARVPVDAGRIVPEGSKAIVVVLNWTGSLPEQKLALMFRESNLGSEGFLRVAEEGASSRVFVLDVDNDQTDTTYSNRTTWEFRVLPEGDAGAFHGHFTLTAWVARVAPDAAVPLVRGA